MITPQYLEKISQIINQFFSHRDIRVFIFGSSVRKDHFGDCDIGLIGEIGPGDISKLKEIFEESTLPYQVDIVNFNRVSQSFRDHVLHGEIVWLKN